MFLNLQISSLGLHTHTHTKLFMCFCFPICCDEHRIKSTNICSANIPTFSGLVVVVAHEELFCPNCGSGGIEKSHSCKWVKWIQWHALPHIQQSTQQWNKGYYPNLHGWDFSIPPSPKLHMWSIVLRHFKSTSLSACFPLSYTVPPVRLVLRLHFWLNVPTLSK